MKNRNPGSECNDDFGAMADAERARLARRPASLFEASAPKALPPTRECAHCRKQTRASNVDYCERCGK
jgi:hypothetical protein